MKRSVWPILIVLLLLVVLVCMGRINDDVKELKALVAAHTDVNRKENVLQQQGPYDLLDKYVGDPVFVHMKRGSFYHENQKCLFLAGYECTSSETDGWWADPSVLTTVTSYEAEYRGFKPCPKCRTISQTAD